MSTIYALSSARGRAGVAVFRTSGPQALAGLEILLAGQSIPPPRTAALRSLVDPVSRETIDRGLVLAFPAPRSFTGEDCVEYHLHGGPAIITAMLAAFARLPGHHPADPGDFTRRAFENGKMDLTEAEGLADLIHAETQMQKAQALAQMGGALRRLYEGWAERLAIILAHAEADLEFPEEDLPGGLTPALTAPIQALAAELAAHLQDNRRGERLRDGIQIAVVGAPNAGKSSLVNALAQRDIAIVSATPGTTRDVLEVHLDLGGYPVILCDTAGLRPDQLTGQGQDAIESEGIRRALDRARGADITVLLYDAGANMLDPHTRALEALPHHLVVLNKCDGPVRLLHPGPNVQISAQTHRGLDDLIARLVAEIQCLAGQSESVALTRARHRTALESTLYHLRTALTAPLPELAAEDLRLSLRDLGRITGRVDVEDLLDIVFRDFCIGK